jgi:gas vesicle protein
MALGTLSGALIGGLIGGAAGGVTGAQIGDELDRRVLDNCECLNCGHTFRRD